MALREELHFRQTTSELFPQGEPDKNLPGRQFAMVTTMTSYKWLVFLMMSVIQYEERRQCYISKWIVHTINSGMILYCTKGEFSGTFPQKSRFRNGRLLFDNGRLSFENGRLLFDNDSIRNGFAFFPPMPTLKIGRVVFRKSRFCFIMADWYFRMADSVFEMADSYFKITDCYLTMAVLEKDFLFFLLFFALKV